MTSSQPSCREFRERLTDYLEGALAPSQRARLEAHLQACAGCDRLLGEMRSTLAAMRHLPREQMPVELKRRVLRELLEGDEPGTSKG